MTAVAGRQGRRRRRRYSRARAAGPEPGVGLGARVVHDGHAGSSTSRRRCRGRCRSESTSRPTRTGSSMSVATTDSGPAGSERAPGGRAAVHDAERLVDAVGGQRWVQGRDLAGRLLRVEPVDQGLVGLPAADEAAGLVGRPGPDRVGGVARARHAASAVGHSSLQGEQPGTRGGRACRTRPRGSGSPAHDGAPEPLHLGQVPQQVGGVPVGAGRDAARSGRSRREPRGSEPTRPDAAAVVVKSSRAMRDTRSRGTLHPHGHAVMGTQSCR